MPADNIVVPAGGFSKLMEAFDLERCGNATMALAQASGALEDVLEYVQERRQFGKPIVEFQAVQLRLAEMQMRVDAARLLIYRAACNAERRPAERSSKSRSPSASPTRSRAKSAGDAVQLMGGYGYSQRVPDGAAPARCLGLGHRRRRDRHPEGQYRRRDGRPPLRPAALIGSD